MLEEKQLLPRLPNDPHEAAREIEHFASKVFGNIQIHRCLIASCGKPPGGKSGCRFGLPHAAGEGYSDTRPDFFVAALKSTSNGCLTPQIFLQRFRMSFVNDFRKRSWCPVFFNRTTMECQLRSK